MERDTKPVVHIVDDDLGMRKSLVMLLESSSLSAIGYSSGEEFLAESNATHPACMVLDLRMVGMSGLELLQILRTRKNDLPVILISAHADVPTTVRGMQLGAVTLLQKPVEPSVLLDAIQKSLEISQNLYQEQEQVSSVKKRFEHLTAREMELVALIVEGQANKQIAKTLGIAVKTVANHRASLMAKIGAANAADLGSLFTRFKSIQ
jgi:two-component system response regulator FixJ